jgi:uncharacterized damage-inducible protein DinB
MRKILAASVAALLMAGVAHAQQENPIAQALASEAQGNERNMVSAAEAMPPDKYSFKFETNTFGDLIFHAAAANNMLCSMMAGEKAPETSVKADGQKQALVDQLKQSYVYCNAVFPKVTADRLGEKTKFMTRDVTVAWVIVHAALDWGDHYAQVARMLRANGITPPSAQRRTQ